MKKILCIGAAAVLLGVSGCGTLFRHERIGRRMSDRIDPAVMTVDCALLLCGVIPGVVALILDCDNGSIYFTKAELLSDAPDK